MYPLIFIAKNNLKKKKGDAIILFFLAALAVILLYVSISVLKNTETVLDRAYEKSHNPDYWFMASAAAKEEEITRIFQEQNEVAEFEKSDALYAVSTKYRSSRKEEKKEFAFILESMETEKQIGRLPERFVKKSQDQSIVLPYYLKADGSYQEGDSIYLTLGNREYELIVIGFMEDPLFATPLNVSVYRAYITNHFMEKILKEQPALQENQCILYKARLKDGESSNEFDKMISDVLIKEVPELTKAGSLGLNWELMKSGDAVFSNIAMGIVMAFSMLLILITLIIIRFSVRNFIEDNLKNIGILQAGGYTSRQLQTASFLEFMGITLGGAILGLIIGGIGNGAVGSVQASMLGLSWDQKFDVVSAGIAMAVILGLCFFVTYSASRMYKKVPVLDALRGGIHTHNFRKNNFPVERSVFPVSFVLGGKSILGEKVKNIAVLCIVMLLSFTSCAGFFLYQNFSRDTTNLLKLVGVELGTALVTGEDLEQIGAEAAEWDATEQVIYGDISNIKLTNGKKQVSVTCDIWNDPEKLEHESVVEGRLPKYDNEIVMTSGVSKELGAKVGDTVYVEGAGERKDYLVSGIDQKINNMGKKTLMTMEGAERLNGTNQVTSLYIYAREGYSFSQLQQKLNASFSDIDISDSQKQSADALAAVSIGMTLICGIFVSITVTVVIMVVLLLVKMKIRRERKNYGIYKALGFTTKQLMMQTMMSNLPVILLGTAAGAAAAKYFTNPMVALFLSFCGIQKTDLDTSPLWIFVTVAIIMLAALIAALLSSVKIRKIEPVTLLQEES